MKAPNRIAMLLTSATLMASAAAHAGTDPLSDGLGLLYKNVKCVDEPFCPSAANNAAMIKNAVLFKQKLTDLIGNDQAPLVTWHKAKGLAREFEFNSAYQRPGNHPANVVHGIMYLPAEYDSCDALKYPATLVLHELTDNIDSVKQIGKYTALLNRGVAMVIYLPHFGPRRGDENFISKDLETFETNVLQTMADIHQSYLVLKSLTGVQQNNIGVMGLSLGGMMTLISAGVDPIYDRYATNVGAGDLANIVTYRKSGDVDSQTGLLLKNIDWTVDQARFYLSRFDAITWSLFVKNKTIVMINANSDELINRSLGLDPLIEGYRLAGSDVKQYFHKGTHVFKAKETGFFTSLRKVFLPMLKFVSIGDSPRDVCEAQF